MNEAREVAKTILSFDEFDGVDTPPLVPRVTAEIQAHTDSQTRQLREAFGKFLDGAFSITFNMNDTFIYACADSETVHEYDGFRFLFSLYEKYGHHALSAFAACQRDADVLLKYQTAEYEAAKAEIKAWSLWESHMRNSDGNFGGGAWEQMEALIELKTRREKELHDALIKIASAPCTCPTGSNDRCLSCIAEDALDPLTSPTKEEEKPSEEVIFEEILRDVGRWAVGTFIEATPASWCKHLAREVDELSAKPQDPEEMADCLILIAGLAWKQGIDPTDLRYAVEAKLAINKTRVWGEPDADGVVEHVRQPLPEPPEGE